jgi:hypothetical protein
MVFCGEFGPSILTNPDGQAYVSPQVPHEIAVVKFGLTKQNFKSDIFPPPDDNVTPEGKLHGVGEGVGFRELVKAIAQSEAEKLIVMYLAPFLPARTLFWAERRIVNNSFLAFSTVCPRWLDLIPQKPITPTTPIIVTTTISSIRL